METSFFRFVTVRAFDRETDGQTDRKTLAIPCVGVERYKKKLWTIEKSSDKVQLRFVLELWFSFCNNYYFRFRLQNNIVLCNLYCKIHVEFRRRYVTPLILTHCEWIWFSVSTGCLMSALGPWHPLTRGTSVPYRWYFIASRNPI